MNGAVNFSTNDGWIPEFINNGNNGFVVPMADYANMTVPEQDDYDLNWLYEAIYIPRDCRFVWPEGARRAVMEERPRPAASALVLQGDGNSLQAGEPVLGR